MSDLVRIDVWRIDRIGEPTRYGEVVGRPVVVGVISPPSQSGGGVTDGDKGDIVVSGGGANWAVKGSVLAGPVNALLAQPDPFGQYLTAPRGDARYDASGAADAAVAAHAIALDPHPQYLTPAEGAATFDAAGTAAALIAAATSPDIASGFWFDPHSIGISRTNGVVALNATISLLPFYVAKARQISALGVGIHAAGAAGAKVALALYANTGGAVLGGPTGLPVASATELAATAVGQIVGTLGAPVTLAPGWYWSAVIANDAAIRLTSPAAASMLMSSIKGDASIAAISSPSMGFWLRLTGQAYAAVWPDLTGSVPASTGSPPPIVFQRAA